jgi:hypothetical protein
VFRLLSLMVELRQACSVYLPICSWLACTAFNKECWVTVLQQAAEPQS